MLRSNMRRVLAMLILTSLVISTYPLNIENYSNQIEGNESEINLDENHEHELTDQQKESLKASGLGRSASSTWSATGGSTNVDEIYEMVFDSAGNIVVCGSIFQDSQFGATWVYTEGLGDILIAKLSKDGTWIWAVTAGSPFFYDECRGVTIDSQGNVYGTGYFNGSIDFGTTQITSRGFDGWIARVNQTGQWDWAMNFGGGDIDVGWDIAADNFDNLYVTGFYRNITTFGGDTLVDVSASGDRKFFLAYYNFSVPGWDWAITSTGNGLVEPFQMVQEPSTNSVYIVGYNTGYEEWDNGSFYSNPSSTWAGVLLKYNDSGGFQWGKSISGAQCQFGSNCGVYFNNVIIHPNGGIVVGGNFVGTYVPNTGAPISGYGDWDVLVLRYDINGNFMWDYTAGSPDDDRIQSLSANLKGEVQFGGWHSENMTFGSNELVMNSSVGWYDGFIAQVDDTSKFQWALSIGGAGNDTVGALLTETDGSIISGGDFSYTVWFGDVPKSATDTDIFVWKFQHDKDSDGVEDYVDNCLNAANFNQSNFDSDLKGDACDSDDDNDGLHDVLDDCQYGLIGWNQSNTSLDHDSDGCNDFEEDFDDDNDGVLDLVDNCQKGTLNWVADNISDLDGDGCRDIDEDDDDDADGVLDVTDNCQYVVNPLQEDYEGDGIGDICDGDDDGDGISDLEDNCTKGAINWTSEFQTDKDQDGCEDENSNEDLDDDNDGIFDEYDSCPRGETGWLSGLDNDWDRDGCRNDNEDNDNDNDTVINEIDLCKNGITDWRRNSSNDNDADGCLDEIEDNDDDNDGFLDQEDFCPRQEGSATQGGKGCPDFDEDGWADRSDDFVQDDTQWSDGDGDGLGDNPLGNNPDDCPFFFGNSTNDRLGCVDTDGDGYSDPDTTWTIAQGADAFIEEPTQWADADGDGFGDNENGVNWDLCKDVAGTSTIDRKGCKDTDGDGYSDEDPGTSWTVNLWDSIGIGPDEFYLDPTQWRDTDGDLFGDNWGDPEWNESRDPTWPGIFLENATSADMCPLVSPDGKFDDDINYPGCLLDEPSDGGKKLSDNSASSEDEGLDAVTLFGIIGGVIVLALVGVIVVILNKKSKPKKKRSTPKPLTDLPPPSAPMPAPLPLSSDLDENGEESNDEDTVGSWEDLPGGDYLEPDESGTNWFRANNGDNWYQNSDGTWTKWKD